MKIRCLLLLCALALCNCTRVGPRTADDGSRWWKDVEFLASDELAGRYTGSEGYRKAAQYVARQFQEAGLEPAGTDGYLQEVEFETRKLIPERSVLEIVRNGRTIPLRMPQMAVLGLGGKSGELVEAPLLFAGYGLTIPEAGFDDFRDLPTQGSAIIEFAGAPKSVPPLLSAHYNSPDMQVGDEVRRGVRTALVLANPKVFDMPWEAFANTTLQVGMQPTLPALGGEWKGGPFAFIHVDQIDQLLEGTGVTYQKLRSLDEVGKPLPHFAMDAKLRIRVVFESAKAKSPNVVAVLPGSDPQLKQEFVLISAHLDHVGTGAPVNGDSIYNGAMDNATGVAALLEIARLLRAGAAPKRSVLFLACTGEEEGEGGSLYFAEKPTIDLKKAVAEINLDMYLPLFPLRIIRAYGLRESDLQGYVENAASEMHIRVQDDPAPERDLFIRSDQYSFIKKGIPSVYLTFGYEPGSAEEKIVNAWYEQRYHAPSDDARQPVDKPAAGKFHQLMAVVARRVADAPKRPAWNADSFFRRFVP